MRPITLCCLFVLSTGCALQPSNFEIARFFPLGAGCLAEDSDVLSANGSLDVAPGSPQFFVGVHVVGAQFVNQTAVRVDTQLLEKENRDRPQLTEMQATYRFPRPIGGVTERTFVVPFFADFTDTGEILGPIQLISPALGEQLAISLSPSNDPADVFDLFVDVEFLGVMNSSRAPIRTGIASYPIKVFRSTGLPGGAPCTRLQTTNDLCNYSGQTFSNIIKPTLSCCDGQTPAPIGCF